MLDSGGEKTQIGGKTERGEWSHASLNLVFFIRCSYASCHRHGKYPFALLVRIPLAIVMYPFQIRVRPASLAMPEVSKNFERNLVATDSWKRSTQCLTAKWDVLTCLTSFQFSPSPSPCLIFTLQRYLRQSCLPLFPKEVSPQAAQQHRAPNTV